MLIMPATNSRRSLRPLRAGIPLPTATLAGVLSLLAVLVTAPARATDIVDVYQAALGYDPVLKAAEAGLEATEEVVPQTRSLLLPNVGMQGQTAWNEREFPDAQIANQNFNEHSWSARVSQPIINMANWHTYASAKSTVDAARHDYSRTEQDLIVRTVTNYLNVLRAQALLEATRSNEAAVHRQLEQIQQRFEVGLVAITDVLEAQAAYDLAIVNRVQAVGDHDIFFEILRTLAGQPYEEIDSLSEELPIINPEPSSEEAWVKVALEHNFGILSAESQLTAANETIRARRSGHLPTVDGNITKSYFSTGGPNFLGGQIDQTTYTLTMTLPIYQGGFVNSRTREAQALADRSAQVLADSRRTVSRDTRNLFRRVATDVVRVRARLRAITSAESALEATETGYEVGTRNIVDVLQVQNTLYTSQYDYADSRYSYVLALFLLKQQSGVLAPEDLYELNSFADPKAPVQSLTSLKDRTSG
jgi:outer membrane protein